MAATKDSATASPMNMTSVLSALQDIIIAESEDNVKPEQEGKCRGNCEFACTRIKERAQPILPALTMEVLVLSVVADGWVFPPVEGLPNVSRCTPRDIIITPVVTRIDWNGDRNNLCESAFVYFFPVFHNLNQCIIL
jgi:hypothetical protein